jgi:uncharacterized membrane protein YfcA
MIRVFIWLYVLGSVFASGFFIRAQQDFMNLAIGMLLIISALFVFNKRKEIESWLRNASRKS